MKTINFESYDFKATDFYREHKATLDAYNDHPNLVKPLTRTRYAAGLYATYGLLAPWYDSADDLTHDCHQEGILKQLTGPLGLYHPPARGFNGWTLISGMGNLPKHYWGASFAMGVVMAVYGSGDPIVSAATAFFSSQAAGFGVHKLFMSAGENSVSDRLDQILPELRNVKSPR